MLFNSPEFILFFVPTALVVFYLCRHFVSAGAACTALIIFSFFFYGYWNVSFLALLVFTILINFWLGKIISEKGKTLTGRRLMWVGVSLNLCLLGYFKYLNFFVWNIEQLTGAYFSLEPILLPLAISFFTFQQISYLVDNYFKRVVDHNFGSYALYVVFFPQLIAGPIVQQKDALHQYADRSFGTFSLQNIASGTALFSLGLCKKVLIADQLALVASPVFLLISNEEPVQFFQAWNGALAYTFQLYFDFSGYSEMALGLGLMFGIALPVNFNSPYRARNIGEFWQRWHITLTKFLTKFVFEPMSFSFARKIGVKKTQSFLGQALTFYLPILITFLLSGLWHGAGWTFITWGLIHGLALLIFYFWSRQRLPRLPLFIGWLLTTLVNVIALVFFRSSSMESASSLLWVMAGGNGISVPNTLANLLGMSDNCVVACTNSGPWLGEANPDGIVLVVLTLLICLLPVNNVVRFGFINNPRYNSSHLINFPGGVMSGMALIACLIFILLNATTEFLYFQF